MNKHNIIELFEYKKNKEKVKHEHQCFEFLDRLKDRIDMSKTYAKNFRQYIECMLRDGHIKQSFANNLNQQVDLIVMACSSSIARREIQNERIL